MTGSLAALEGYALPGQLEGSPIALHRSALPAWEIADELELSEPGVAGLGGCGCISSVCLLGHSRVEEVLGLTPLPEAGRADPPEVWEEEMG